MCNFQLHTATRILFSLTESLNQHRRHQVPLEDRWWMTGAAHGVFGVEVPSSLLQQFWIFGTPDP